MKRLKIIGMILKKVCIEENIINNNKLSIHVPMKINKFFILI